jgi:hypothetical protein
MMNLFTCTVLLLLVSAKGFSQDGAQWDWQPGFYIQLNGDTIHGFIDSRSSFYNQRFCCFRLNDQTKLQELNPSQILGFKIDGGRSYLSKMMKIQNQEVPTFLEVLFSGECSIYYYLGENSRYFAEKQGQFLELTNTREEVKTDNGTFIRDKNEFVGTLSILLQDGHMQSEIQKCRLERESLIKIAKMYHGRLNPDEKIITVEKKKKKVNVDVGFTAGRNTMTNVIDNHSNLKSEKKGTYYGGALVSINTFPAGKKIFSLNTGLMLNTYYRHDKAKYTLYFPVFVGFKLSTKKFYPQIEAGISVCDVEVSFDIEEYLGISLHYKGTRSPNFFFDAHYDIYLKNMRYGIGILF